MRWTAPLQTLRRASARAAAVQARLLLGAVYFLAFPWFWSLRRRDPLRLAGGAEESFWEPRPRPSETAESLRRLF